MHQSDHRTRTESSRIRQLFGVVVDPQTYRNAFYLLLTFPLGLCYFTAIVTGVSVGFSTLVILVGVPILAALLVFVVHLAAFEARMANYLLGTEVDYDAGGPDDESAIQYCKGVALDPRTYLAGAYLLSKFVIGIAAFTLLVTLSSLTAAFLAAPVFYDNPDVTYQIGVWEPTTLPEAGVVSLLGLAIGLVGLHAVNLSAWLVGEYTEVMLGAGDEGSDGAVDGADAGGD